MAIPKIACAAVATAIVFDLTLVADTSQSITKHIGPKEQPRIERQQGLLSSQLPKDQTCGSRQDT